MTVARRCALGAALLALLLAGACEPGGEPPPMVTTPIPAEHADGAALFDAHCVSCHGERASGSEQGPPLVHRIYEPSHHGDAAFLLAVQRGVKAHHWRFGDMARIEGLGEDEVARITGYVRWLQREAGID